MLVSSLVMKLYILAHSWYPASCCSNQDCVSVPCHQIVETAKGFAFNGLDAQSVYASKDNFCHACVTASNVLKCLFVQYGS